jgi:hypothetical protein
MSGAVMVTTPLCAHCQKEAWCNHDGWSKFCGPTSCKSRIRICSSCDGQFDKTDRGAGSKYCANCRSKASCGPNRIVDCAWCGAAGFGVRPRSAEKWPYICKMCLAPIRHVVDRLKAHNVSPELAMQLSVNGACHLCKRDITNLIVGDHGAPKALLVVDHDHNCCNGTTKSCGKCVRGFLCPGCNIALGMIKDDAKVAVAMAMYLDPGSLLTWVIENHRIELEVALKETESQ